MWWKQDIPCHKCQKHVTYKSGIICTNYGSNRGTFHQCQGAWCGECFIPHILDRFKILVPRGVNGASLAEVEDGARFRKARSDDHLCTVFQCPNCQSQNVCRRDLEDDEIEDDTFHSVCIRATLDAFWAHSFKIVSGHISEVKLIYRYTDMQGIIRPFPGVALSPSIIIWVCCKPLWSSYNQVNLEGPKTPQ